VLPRYLSEVDHPWLEVLLVEWERFASRPKRELDARSRQPLPCVAPTDKLRMASHVLERLWTFRQSAALPARRARAVLFGAAAEGFDDRAILLSKVAASLDRTADELEQALLSDLPSERIVGPRPESLSAGELALRTNLAMARALVLRSRQIRIELLGSARPVVRHARLRGLICTAPRPRPGSPAVLEVSGPFALFRRTRLYGNALGELLPMLAWCHQFRLRADCCLRDRHLTFELRKNDPIFPSSAPQTYDSKLEERFAGDLRRAAPELDVIREPAPIEAGGTLIFPDFQIRHRPSGRSWLVEIVGFWTRDYVAQKLARYRAANLPELILCIDENRSCDPEDPPSSALVVPFRRRIDVHQVLRRIFPGGCPR